MRLAAAGEARCGTDAGETGGRAPCPTARARLVTQSPPLPRWTPSVLPAPRGPAEDTAVDRRARPLTHPDSAREVTLPGASGKPWTTAARGLGTIANETAPSAPSPRCATGPLTPRRGHGCSPAFAGRAPNLSCENAET